MRLCAKAAVLGVWAVIAGAQTGHPHLTLEQQLHGPYGIRIQILKRMLLSDDLLAEPQTRRAVIRLLNHDTTDPKSRSFAESLQWQEYYGKLGEVVQKIAAEYHDRTAWDALVSSAYNAPSDFGEWLASQPDAVDSLWAFRTSENQYVRANVTVVLGMALGRCETKNPDPSCEAILSKKADVLAFLRKNAFDDLKGNSLAVIALGYCGDREDGARLGRTRPSKMPADDMKYWLDFVHQAQQRIEARLGQ
jgi:hypothetical protein